MQNWGPRRNQMLQSSKYFKIQFKAFPKMNQDLNLLIGCSHYFPGKPDPGQSPYET